MLYRATAARQGLSRRLPFMSSTPVLSGSAVHTASLAQYYKLSSAIGDCPSAFAGLPPHKKVKYSQQERMLQLQQRSVDIQELLLQHVSKNSMVAGKEAKGFSDKTEKVPFTIPALFLALSDVCHDRCFSVCISLF